MKPSSSRIRPSLLASIPAALLLTAWVLTAWLRGPSIVPWPWTVARQLVVAVADAQVLLAIGQTVARALVSFLVAAVLGGMLGALPGRFANLRRGFEGLSDFLRSIPAPTLLPLFMSILGLYAAPKIALCVFACTLINGVSMSHGIRREEESLRTEFLRSVGASDLFIFRHGLLPGALPQLLAGLRVTLSLSLVLATLGEILLMTGHGIGVLIRLAYEDRHRPEMYALIVLVGLVGHALARVFAWAEARILGARFRRGERSQAAAVTPPMVAA